MFFAFDPRKAQVLLDAARCKCASGVAPDRIEIVNGLRVQAP
jgi:hypothetical protein